MGTVSKGYWKITKDKQERHRFKLVAGNGEPVLQSEPYTTERAAVEGIRTIERIVGEGGLKIEGPRTD